MHGKEASTNEADPGTAKAHTMSLIGNGNEGLAVWGGGGKGRMDGWVGG